MRATLDRLAEVGDALFGHQMLNVRHQHDAVACRDAEERDEPDHGRDAQHATGEKYARNAANQRERQIDHDDDRITSAAERQHQQHEESGDHSDEQDPEAPGGALLTLELSPVLDAVSRRHRRRLRDVRPDVVDHAAEISAGDVAGNHDPALHVLAQDHVRSFLTSYVGQQADRHLARCECVDREIGNTLEVAAARRIELHDQIECRAAIEDAANRRAREAGLNRLADVARMKAVARDRRSIEDEPHDGYVHLLFEREIDDSRHATDGVAHTLAEPPKRAEVVAEDLHSDVGSRTRQHVIDAVRDRLSDRDVGARKRREAAPQRRQQLCTRPASIAESHVDLRRFDALYVLVELRAPCASGGRHYFGLSQHDLLDAAADFV